jgi:2-aminoadipate transaminase
MNDARVVLSARAGWAGDQPIGELINRALAQPELISLAAGFVDHASLPAAVTQSAALAVLADPERARAALQYGSTAGDPELRRQVLARVLEQDRAAPDSPSAVRDVDLEQVLLAAGSNQILYLLAQALLDPGDIVLCESPTYFVFAGIVRGCGARPIAVSCDDSGMNIEALDSQLDALARSGELTRVKAIYVMSYFDNPRSISLAQARRAALVALAKRYSREQRIYVIEDAAYRELRYAGEDRASLHAHDAEGDTVVYAGTFSKSFSPGVRVGFGILPAALSGAVTKLKVNLDFGSPHLNQHIVSEALRLGLYEPHAALLRSIYTRKLASMLRALDQHLGEPGLCRYARPSGGLYVWLEVVSGLDTGMAGPLLTRALAEGVLYVPGSYCFPEPTATSQAFMRLSFGVQSDERIALGIEKLARAIRSCRTRS